MKKFNKLLCTVISAAILLTTFVFPVTSNAEVVYGTLIRNGGFENGNETEAYDWGLWPGWDRQSFITTEDVHSGKRAIKVDLNEGQNYALFAGGYTPASYDQHSSVELSAWVKYENLEGGFVFGAERKENDQNVAGGFSERYTGTSDGWQRITYKLPYTAANISETIIKFDIATGSGTLLIDDVSIELKKTGNVMLNSSFEDGDKDNHFGCYNAETFITEDENYVRTGSKAIKFEQSDKEFALWSDSYNSSSFDVTKTTEVSVYAKYENITGAGFRIITENGGCGNIESRFYTGSSDGWTKLTLVLPEDNRRTSVLFKVSVSAGTGTVAFDDVSISPADEQNYIQNGNFESGANSCFGLYNDTFNEYATSESYSGTVGLKVLLSSERNYSVWSDGYDSNRFDVTKSFIASAMIRYENMTDGNFYMHANRGEGAQVNSTIWNLRGNSNGWEEFKFIVPADANATIAQVQLEFSAGAGTVWVDDVRLYDNTSSLVNYAQNHNASFENTHDDNGVIGANDWGMYPDWNENAFVTNEAHHTGANSVKITLNDSQNYAFWNGFGLEEFDVSQALTFSAWIMVPAETPITGTMYLGAERGRYDLEGIGYNNFTTNGEWVRVTRNFTPYDGTIESFVLKSEISAGTGVIYIDDLEIYPTTSVFLNENSTYATVKAGTVRAGDRVEIYANKVENKVVHLYIDGKKLDWAGDDKSITMTDEDVVITASYDDLIMGDANDDGAVNIVDLVVAKKKIANQLYMNINLDAIDFDNNGQCNSEDLTALIGELLK